jgi:hypothetical protein
MAVRERKFMDRSPASTIRGAISLFCHFLIIAVFSRPILSGY